MPRGIPNQAKNNPVSSGGQEHHSDEVAIRQRKPVDIDAALDGDDDSHIVTAEELARLNKEDRAAYHAELLFMEEPVTIVIQKSSEKFAPNVLDCWVNGKGAEHFRNGKWMTCGWLPVGAPVITKRKYVEVLATRKADSYETKVVKYEDHEDNQAIPYSSMKYPFSVLSDPSGTKGYEWLTRLLRSQ